MKQFLRGNSIRVALAILFAACSGLWPVFATCETQRVQIDDHSDPQALVQTATQEILDEVRVRAIDPDDIPRIMDIVERDILPYTDIERTTKFVMGRFWRTSTPAQQQEVVEQFKLLLIHTYSGALALLRPDQQIQYPPSRIAPNQADVVVRTVAMDGSRQVEIDYRLYRTRQGWRLYDLNVVGVWLVQIYRLQFSEEIQKSGVDGLIKLLRERNEKLADGGS